MATRHRIVLPEPEWPVAGLRLATGLMLISLVAVPPAWAGDTHVGPVANFINANVRHWISDPVIVDALKAQNAANVGTTKCEIAALDAEWVRQINSHSHPMIDKALATPLSHFLKAREDEASGTITEVIVMDAMGLNAGQSGVTSDYWQGDEDKFIKSFDVGPAAMFVDSAHTDESTQMLQSQVSMTIVDEHNRPIGAITIGVNLDQL